MILTFERSCTVKYNKILLGNIDLKLWSMGNIDLKLFEYGKHRPETVKYGKHRP